jgi:hypothetical protein
MGEHLPWWCCKADYPDHEPDCENYVSKQSPEWEQFRDFRNRCQVCGGTPTDTETWLCERCFNE